MSSFGDLSTEAEIRDCAMKAKEKAIFVNDSLIPFHSFADFEHFYIGDEFCERRLPSILTLKNMHNYYDRKDIKLTLATPYLTNEGIKKLTQILNFIAQGNVNLEEVVINDWGALRLLKDYNDRFRIVLGRILVSRYLKEQHSKKFAQQHLRNDKKVGFHCLFPDSFLDFIKEQNIACLEFNSYYHLAITHKQVSKYGFKVHIYYPFIYLTTSRYCTCINGYRSYFRNSIENCNEDCKEYIAVITNRHFANGIFIKGNAYFIKQEKNLEDFNNLEVDRLIYNDFIKVS